VRAPVVVELDPVAQHASGMLLTFEAVAVDALLLQSTDDAFDHAVLLRAVRGNELLPQALAADQAGVVPARENQPVVRTQQERSWDASQHTEAGDRLLQCGCRGAGLAGPR
jgi:hypothetical protein